MRALALLLIALFGLAAAPAAAAPAAEATLRASRTGVTLATPELRAMLRGSEAAGLDKAEIGLEAGVLQARLFRNAGVVGDFTASRLNFGKIVRSPYLARLGLGDGASARFRTGPYAVAGAVLSGPRGDSAAGEVSAIGGALTLQGGYRATGGDTGSAGFAGAHLDLDVLNAELSLRWHAGSEEVADGTRETSAGGVVVGVQSVLEDGDRLRAAMSRPVGPDFDLQAPDVALSYMMPMPVGRLTCSGSVETLARVSTLRVAWGLAW